MPFRKTITPGFKFSKEDLNLIPREEERRVLYLREGMDGNGARSFAGMAPEFGMTAAGVHKLYKAGLRNLETAMAKQGILSGRIEESENSVLLKAASDLATLFPTLVWVPNSAQRRMAKPWEKPPYPFMVINSCGNGTGKTDYLPQDICGCLNGPEYLNDCWNRGLDREKIGMTHYQYYHDCRELREAGKFQYRLLCSSEDMKDGGSLCLAIRQYIPTAIFKGKSSTGSYQKIEIPFPGNPSVKNIIDIKTFEQELTAHAGANLHRIGVNEPPPFDVFTETISRIRSKKDSVQCTIVIAATILKKATYLFDLEQDDYFKGKVLFIRGSIWENCVGEEITDEVAEQLKEKLNVILPKDADGKYQTFGHLTKESIENQIHFFERTDPNEIETRIWGANAEMFGAEFKNFNINVHRVPEHPIPARYPVIQIVDPHPVKPDLSAWAYVDPLLRLHFFEEWPHLPWEKLKSRNKTITQTCAEWDDLEMRYGIKDRIATRIGDPNRFKTADSRDNLQLWVLYIPHGYSFNLFVNDGLEYGHQLIHSAMYYDKRIREEDPSDILAQPGIDFTENCKNLINSCTFYGRKDQSDSLAAPTEKIDLKWKDGMDLIRYALVWLKGKSFEEIMNQTGGSDNTYALIKKSREVQYEDECPIPKFKLKGRQFAGMVR